jgi:hypothetical protein
LRFDTPAACPTYALSSMVGESNRSIQYRRSFDDTMSDLARAFGSVGKVLDSSETTGTISGRVRYGLQTVRLRVSVFEETPERSRIEIQGFGDDIWGGGARKGADKLIQALGASQKYDPTEAAPADCLAPREFAVHLLALFRPFRRPPVRGWSCPRHIASLTGLREFGWR